MKLLLLKYLLQLPLLYFYVSGVSVVVGDNFWISTLIGISCLMLYNTADYLEDNKND